MREPVTVPTTPCGPSTLCGPRSMTRSSLQYDASPSITKWRANTCWIDAVNTGREKPSSGAASSPVITPP
jgi:hypothetical protein